MKRIGKGDYAWSTTRADLETEAGAIGLQSLEYAEKGDEMMAVGTALLAGRCGLDFIDTEARERLPRGNDVHYADKSTRRLPLCGRKATIIHETPATTSSEGRTDCWECRERLRKRRAKAEAARQA